MAPVASVVILSHRPAFLPEAVASVLAQTAPEVQLVVQHCPANWPTKLNEAVAATRGEYVVILCDDDLLDPTYLAECLSVAALGADIVYTDRRVFEDGTAPQDGFHFRMHGDAFQGERAYWIQQRWEDFRFGSSLPMTCLIRRTWWDRMAGYDTMMPHADTEFWFRSVLNGAKCAYIPRPLFWYRRHAEQQSVQQDTMRVALEAFHRKHFVLFGVCMETATEIGPKELRVTVIDPDHRMAHAAARMQQTEGLHLVQSA